VSYDKPDLSRSRLVLKAEVDTYLSGLVLRSNGRALAAVAQVFINNGRDVEIASNNMFFGEVTVPHVVTPLRIDWPVRLGLPPGYRVIISGLPAQWEHFVAYWPL
jgi:hypothetical protein